MRRAGFAFFTITILFLFAGCFHPSAADPLNDRSMRPKQLPSAISVEEPAAPAGDTPALTDDSTLADYLAYAALHNPGLEAAFNRWQAADARIGQVRSLPDPRFTYRYYIQEVETRVGAQQQAFGISQTFPWFDKLSLKGDAASDAANAARKQYEAAKLKLFYQVKDAYYEYAYLLRAIGIVEENVELVKNFEEVVRIRYQTGAAQHPSVIRAQIELGKLEDRLRSLREMQGPITARLNAALNRLPDSPVAPPTAVAEEMVALTDGQILDLMAKSNPELAALDYEIARNRTGIDLAKKDYYPDLTFGVDFIDTSKRPGPMPPSDNGKDPIIAMVSLNLPIWREKLDAGVREARYAYNAAVRSQADKLNMLNAQLKMALYQFRDDERKINLYRDTLLPKAVESVKANETAFRSGESSFLEVIDAQRVMLEFELSSERALTGKAQRLAELEMLVGTALPRSENTESSDGASESVNH